MNTNADLKSRSKVMSACESGKGQYIFDTGNFLVSVSNPFLVSRLVLANHLGFACMRVKSKNIKGHQTYWL